MFSVAATPPSATANSVKEVTIAQRFDNSEDLVTTDAVNEAATKITDESQSDLTTIVPSTEKDEFDLTNEIPWECLTADEKFVFLSGSIKGSKKSGLVVYVSSKKSSLSIKFRFNFFDLSRPVTSIN